MNVLVLTFIIQVLCPTFQQRDAEEEYHILIHKSEFSLALYRGEEIVKRYSVCVGKNPGNKERRNDRKTPEGEFVISQIQDSRHWVYDFKDGKGEIAGAYGPWFLRLRAISGRNWEGIGMHGTHDPASIGTRASEGCVRLRNEDLVELKSLVAIGTPVAILP